MALQKQPISIVFGGGVDTRTDSKLVVPAKLLTCENAVFLDTGSLSKRNGYRALGNIIDETGRAYANPQGLAARSGELILFADGNSLSYRPTSNTWQTIGVVSSIVADGSTLARTGTNQTQPDAATNNGITALAWEDSNGGVWGAVVEAASQRVLVPATQLDAAGKMPRVLAVGEVVHVLWVNGPIVWVSIVNPSAPGSFGAASPLITDMNAAVQGYDAVATLDSYDATSKPGCIAWITPGGYKVGYIHPSGVLGSPATGLPVSAFWPIAVGVIGAPIAVAFTAAGGLLLVAIVYQKGITAAAGALLVNVVSAENLSNSYTDDTLQPTPQTFKRVTAEWANYDSVTEQTLWWAGEAQGTGAADTNLVQYGSFSTAGSPSAVSTLRGHCLASRAWNDNGAIFVSVVHAVKFYPYVAVVQLSAGARAQARLLPGLSSGQLTRPILPSVTPISPSTAPGIVAGPPSSYSRQHALTLGYRIQLGGVGGAQFGEQGIQLFSLDYDHADSFHAAQLGGGIYLSGALIQHYDGSRWSEHNFHCAPDTAAGGLAAPSQSTGGSLTLVNEYGYKVLYEEIDAQGELHPGAVSVLTTLTLTASNNKVTLTIPTCRLTSKNRVRIGVFRSIGNDDSQYFRVSSVDPTATGANGYLVSDPTVDTVTFVDGMSDATAKQLEPLYTNGGILSNDPEQSGGAAIVGGKTRLFWLDPLDGNLVNYSQALRDDTAAELSQGLSVRVDPFGGDIVAIAVMDDIVVVFKSSAIFAFGGPGPDADGGKLNPSNAWTQPQILTTDVGCSSPSSVANVPDGIVFQSAKGPCLLGRDTQVKMIGNDVFGYRNQHISRATLLPDRPMIVFLTDVDQGRTLMFDYSRGQWSTFTNHTGIDALVLNGSYYYLGTDGQVYIETPGEYRDGTRHIQRIVETAWVKLTGYAQGWQRIWYASVLGTYYSSHQLSVGYRIDYQEGYTFLDPVNVDESYNPSLYGAGAYGVGDYSGTVEANTVYQEEFHINRRCMAISFRIADIEDSDSYGAAFDLTELLLLGGIIGPKFMPGLGRSQ